MTVNSSGTATDTGNGDVLNLTGKATFTNTGTYELQDNGDSIVSSDGTGTFINAGTLAKTGTGASFIRSTSTKQPRLPKRSWNHFGRLEHGELEFRDGGTFTGATTLNTSAGSGKVDFNTGTFTVAESASFQGGEDDLALFMESQNSLLAIEGNLTLDVLTLAGGDVQIDSNNTGVSTLGVGQLRVISTGSSITGSNTTTPDDVLNIGTSGFDLQHSIEISGLTVNSTGTATMAPGFFDELNLTGNTTFNNAGTFEFQGSNAIVSSDGTGIFVNAGTLGNTGSNASFIGSTATNSDLTFLNSDATISVASGSEIEFRDGGTFDGVTTLNTSGGTGKIDLNTGTFTVDVAASFQGVSTGDRALFMENQNGTLLIGNSLTLDALTLAGGAVVLDLPGDGVATLSLDELRVTNSGSSITGVNGSSPDDILNLNTTFEQPAAFTLRGLIVNSQATVTSGSGCCVNLYLSDNTVFNNSGIFQFQGSSGGLSSASPDSGDTDAGVFINTGTIAKLDASITRIGETAGTLAFQNNGGTISVVSGGELEFREGGTFTGVTTLNTAAGAGKVDLPVRHIYGGRSSFIRWRQSIRSCAFLGTGGESVDSTLNIEGDLTLDALGLFVDATVNVDSNSDGASTLSVGQITTNGLSNNIIGGADDLLVVGAGGLQMSSTFTLSGLSATSPLTTISAGSLKRLDLNDGAVFTKTPAHLILEVLLKR